MFDITKAMVYELLDQGCSLREITADIAMELNVRMIYMEGPLKFIVEENGSIICEGDGFRQCVVDEHCPCYLVEDKFREYFNKAIYMDLSDYDNHIIDEILYKDLNFYNALFDYIWEYLRQRIF